MKKKKGESYRRLRKKEEGGEAILVKLEKRKEKRRKENRRKEKRRKEKRRKEKKRKKRRCLMLLTEGEFV